MSPLVNHNAIYKMTVSAHRVAQCEGLSHSIAVMAYLGSEPCPSCKFVAYSSRDP